MTTAKHTPGPWDFDSTDFEVYDMESGESLDITEANAQLIAAAPDLLEELKKCVLVLNAAADKTQNALVSNALYAQAEITSMAIAKATGVPA